MEPEENPYAVLLAIDYPAMKAREYHYLIDLRDSPEWIDETGYLLNIHYTAALAEYTLEKEQKKDHTKSSESLSKAIQKFPSLIAQLFYALKITFPANFPTTLPPSPLQALYNDLYIHRSKELWIIPEISQWLNIVTKEIAKKVVEPPPSQTLESIPLNVARHIFVMNVPALMSHIPREYTSRTQLASDPLPPENSISPYDAPIRSLPRMARDENALNRWIAGLVRGEREANPAEIVEEEEDEDEEEEEEQNDTLVAQLTNTFRNVFGWFSREQNPRDDEPQDDGHGVD
jgi:Transcriptional repressor TCF25